MKITVCGKQERKGTSKKTGNDYHFNVVYFVGPARGVMGKKSQEMVLDPVLYPINSIQVDHEYDVDFSPEGEVMDFKLVK